MENILPRVRSILASMRPAFAREATFRWFCIAVLAMLAREDLRGVASLVRGIGAGGRTWKALLAFFASRATDAGRIGARWAGLVLSHPACVRMNGRHLVVVDGTKIAKSGRCMPGNKKLHQSSASNTKPEYITGHSCQTVAVLLSGLAGTFAVPIFTNIFEGLRWKGMPEGSQLGRLGSSLGEILLGTKCYIVADAYYMAASFILEALGSGAHVITRARGNAVAHLPPEPQAGKRGRGAPRKYGAKVALASLATQEEFFVDAESPVYGEAGIRIRYREVLLVSRPLGREVKFVIVRHPVRGTIFLVCTDRMLPALDVVTAYGLRFKIEVSFKAAAREVGAFAYRFWSMSFRRDHVMKGDVDIAVLPPEEARAILAKVATYHLHMMVGHVAQGIAQMLAIEMPAAIAKVDREYRRTLTEMPSEATVMKVFRRNLGIFAGLGDDPEAAKYQVAEFIAGNAGRPGKLAA